MFAFLLSALKTQSLQQTVCLVSLIAQIFLAFLVVRPSIAQLLNCSLWVQLGGVGQAIFMAKVRSHLVKSKRMRFASRLWKGYA